MSGDISKFLMEQRQYILEEKRRLGIVDSTGIEEKVKYTSAIRESSFSCVVCYTCLHIM